MLKPAEELDLFEQRVEPAVGDAVVGQVRRGVMLRVVLRAQDEMRALQEARDARRHVRVRPLVELIRRHGGRRHQHGGQHGEDAHRRNFFVPDEGQAEADERRGEDAGVAVRGDEVVRADVFRVDVVEAKRLDEVCAEERRAFAAVSVCEPVYEAGDQIAREHAEREGEEDEPEASLSGESREAQVERGGEEEEERVGRYVFEQRMK